MSENVVIALVSCIPTIVAVIMANNIVTYKIEELQKRVEKHNQIIERTYILERDTKTAFNEIKEIKDDIEKIQDRILSA